MNLEGENDDDPDEVDLCVFLELIKVEVDDDDDDDEVEGCHRIGSFLALSVEKMQKTGDQIFKKRDSVPFRA